MKNLNKSVGNLAETIAKDHLAEKGYIILKINFSSPHGEIDIITFKPSNLLSFVEVKSRYSLKYGIPIESINYNKQQKIIKTAQYYMNKYNFHNYFCSFDAVEIIFNYDDNSYELNHFKNIFYLK